MQVHIARSQALRQIDRVHALILGASRGLGRELARVILEANGKVTGVARKADKLAQIAQEYSAFEYVVADFTKLEGQSLVLKLLRDRKFDRVFYCAGGGPYGPFHQFSWASHQWAFDVTFTFAAQVLHQLAREPNPPQMTLIGSAVAESRPDPGAVSYCAAKHALRGLFECLKLEYPNWDLRLYSPGYMDTDMIPPNAAVRKKGVHSPRAVAEDVWRWTLTSGSSGHMMAAIHPEEKP